jgi:hypothetical protein
MFAVGFFAVGMFFFLRWAWQDLQEQRGQGKRDPARARRLALRSMSSGRFKLFLWVLSPTFAGAYIDTMVGTSLQRLIGLE